MVLITGGNGRIGNVLVRQLNKRGEVPLVLARKSSNLKSLDGCKCKIVYGDILDPITVEDDLNGVDTIFHLAGNINITPYNSNNTIDVNVQGTENILYLCKKRSIKLVYTSSIHALSAPADGSLITEDTPFCTDSDERRSVYDCSKAQATKSILKAQAEGLDTIIVHPTGVIGPYDFEPSIFGRGMIQTINSGIKVTIGGRYDYVDVRDVTKAMLDAYEKKKFGERYILSSRIMSMRDYMKYLKEFTRVNSRTIVLNKVISKLLAEISTLLNKKSQITPYGVETLYSNANISHAKASSELGYKPRDPKESVHDQYKWFVENGYLY